jgi:hypothetical protein
MKNLLLNATAVSLQWGRTRDDKVIYLFAFFLSVLVLPVVVGNRYGSDPGLDMP